MYWLKLTKQYTSYANFEKYYQVQRQLLYTKLSYGQIWTMVISCPIRLLNNSFKEKLESIQYNACLTLIGAIRGRKRSWKVKILNMFSAWFLQDILYTRLEIHNIPLLNTKQNIFKKSFFPSTIIEWKPLDPRLRKAESFFVFKSNILKFIRPSSNFVYNYHNPRKICLITKLRLGLSHLRE